MNNESIDDYISIKEFALLKGSSYENIKQGCQTGRFKSAKKLGSNWIISKNEEMIDRRIKSGKYKGWRDKKQEN